jgi:5'-3' exoribonuclease 1
MRCAAMDIADEAFDLLFYTYRDERKKWLKNKKSSPYLIEAGTIVCGDRLQNFLQAVGRHELMYFQSKKVDLEQDRMIEAKYGMNTIPDDEVIAEKEAADRAMFRELVQSSDQPHSGFRPVLSARPKQFSKDDDEDLSEHMGSLLRITVDGGKKNVKFDDRDVKGRYYSDKFGFSPVDAMKHTSLRKEYVKGLVWNLKYYYEGCVSWDYYYPYHYGPMLSDVVGIKKMLEEIEFELGKPLRPFDQLMACM